MAPTTDTASDLNFTEEIISKLNITNHDQKMKYDDNHLHIIDEHPTVILSQWTKKLTNEFNANDPKPSTNCANAVHDPVSGAYLEYRELLKTSEKDVRRNSFANELGRLSQGYKNNNIKGTNTIHFTPWYKLPPGKKATYACICCDHRPHKTE